MFTFRSTTSHSEVRLLFHNGNKASLIKLMECTLTKLVTDCRYDQGFFYFCLFFPFVTFHKYGKLNARGKNYRHTVHGSTLTALPTSLRIIKTTG